MPMIRVWVRTLVSSVSSSTSQNVGRVVSVDVFAPLIWFISMNELAHSRLRNGWMIIATLPEIVWADDSFLPGGPCEKICQIFSQQYPIRPFPNDLTHGPGAQPSQDGFTGASTLWESDERAQPMTGRCFWGQSLTRNRCKSARITWWFFAVAPT